MYAQDVRSSPGRSRAPTDRTARSGARVRTVIAESLQFLGRGVQALARVLLAGLVAFVNLLATTITVAGMVVLLPVSLCAAVLLVVLLIRGSTLVVQSLVGL